MLIKNSDGDCEVTEISVHSPDGLSDGLTAPDIDEKSQRDKYVQAIYIELIISTLTSSIGRVSMRIWSPKFFIIVYSVSVLVNTSQFRH